VKQEVKKIALVFFILSLLPSAYAKSSVWKISDGDKHLYIGGTIHVLGASDYPLPDEFERAFEQAGKLILETDIGGMQNPELQTAFVRMMTYPHGQNLRQKLSAETYRLLEQYLVKRGIPVVNLINYKPGMILTSLVMIELQRMGITGAGVDMHYHSRVLKNKTPLGQLETIEEQLQFIAGMGIGQEDAFIAYTLQDLQELPELFKLMKNAWRSGDSVMFEKEILVPWEKEFSGIYDLLLVKRNNAWMPKIEAMLKTKDVELVLVGVLHLAGKDGLLKKFAAKGYRVEQLQ
jgi:hypothetical protein